MKNKKEKTQMYVFLILLMLFLLIPGCKKDLTPADNTPSGIKLTVEDVGVTEAWLRLNIQNPKTKSQITISRNDSTIKQLNNLTTDTLIYDTGLLPNHDYTYTATLTTDGRTLIADSHITTMDTTSHDFAWNIITIGDGNTCLLRDICIINEDDIWAVGEIHTNETDRFDSLGNWIDPYNAVHWNGNEWELKRILTKASFGEPRYVHLRSIFAFSENDIWITNYVGGYGHWNGTEWETDWKGVGENKIWGTSSNDLYFVGSVGLISHYNGQTWERIESGTDVDLYDVYGYSDELSGTNYQLFSGFEYDGVPDDGIILKNEENKIEIIDNGVDGIISSDFRNDFASVWTDSYYNFWVISAGDVFKLIKTGQNIYKRLMMLDGFRGIHRIRGTGANDIFVTGYYVKLRHFNGKSWFHFSELDDAQISLKSLDFKNDIVAAVGENRIYLGIRQ